MENGYVLTTKNLDVYCGKTHILKDVSISIPQGKITAIIGPSGCGKTTLLKCLNRLLETREGFRISGEVLVDGENIYSPQADVTAVRKKMGLLSQRPYPLPMSIYDNIAFGPRLQGVRARKELDGIVEHYLREASLWEEVCDRLLDPAASLSIGQQQRLCLARGLAVEPEIILGDEPTSALDPKSTISIEKKFMELKNRYSIVMVTHILRQARRLADYIIYIHSGKIIEQGEAAEILENPREKKTKEYITGIIS